MPERPLAILFDLDGTLIDSVELIVTSMRYAFQSCGRTAPSDEEWIALIGTPLATQLRTYASSDAEVTALHAAYRRYQHEHHDRLIRCFDDVVDTIALLHERAHPMAIVTSKSDPIAWRSLQYVGLDAYIGLVIGCESCARHKPDPEPVHVALDRLGHSPDAALFVGDSPYDVEAGNAAGVISVAALWGPFTREALAPSRPRYYLERIRDLPDLVTSVERPPVALQFRAAGSASSVERTSARDGRTDHASGDGALHEEATGHESRGSRRGARGGGVGARRLP